MTTTDTTTARSVSTSRVIAADRQTLFDLVADPQRHPDFDGSGSVKARLSGPDRLSLGAKFGMRMHLLAPYVIRNVVVEFEEGERLAWRHFGRHRWRYEFADVDGGTEVTETFDWSTALSHRYIERSGFPARNLEGMEKTLLRLDALATA